MKAIFDDRQLAHNPEMYVTNGVLSRCPEQPERADALQAGALAAGCTFDVPRDHGMKPIQFQAFNITTEGFSAIGAAITSAGLSVLHVQEGGYLQPELGKNLTGYLNGAEGQR